MKKFSVFCCGIPLALTLRLALLTLCTLMLVGEPALAERVPEVQAGMPASRLLDLWGEPTERIEREVDRVVVWEYPAGSVVVRGDKVVSVPDRFTAAERALDQKKRLDRIKAERGPGAQSSVHDLDGGSEDIIREVLKALPPEDPNSAASGAPPPAPGRLRASQPHDPSAEAE